MIRKPQKHSKGGAFANGPRAGVAESYAFIRAQKARGVPLSAVARMVGRNPADVALIYDAPCLEAVPRTPRLRRTAPPPPPLTPVRPCAKAACLRPIPRRALKVIAPVLSAHGATWDDVAGPLRHQEVTAARQACYAALRAAGFSRAVIGSYFGGRDRSTVLHGIRKHLERTAGAAPAAREAA